jgi:protein TonB
MNGYKTGGDWTDVTSIGRNEVVFEGRHKAYGAYYIRQRYPNALYLSMFTAVTFVAVCSLVPYAFRNVKLPDVINKPDIVVTPIDIPNPPKVIPHPIVRPPVQPPKPPAARQTPPFITSQNVDTSIIERHSGTSLPIAGNNIPTDSDYNPLPDPGPVADIPKPEPPLLIATEMPKFPGGNIESYLKDKINYPAEESQSGIQGTIYATFIIEKDGSVSNVSLLRGVMGGPGLTREALRVLSEMPKWIPGKQNGHPVRIQYNIPINFKLR